MTRIPIPRTKSPAKWRELVRDAALEIRDTLWACNCSLAVWVQGLEISYGAEKALPGWTLVGVYDEVVSLKQMVDDIEATAQPEFA